MTRRSTGLDNYSEELVWGDYTLEETKAPAGYEFVAGQFPAEFTISARDLDYEFETAFVNTRRDGPVIPLTGGIGRDAFFIAGLLIIAAGFGAVGVKRVRSRREGVA
jgi:LPXTG-motif cell wall-anchored protein